MRPKPQRQFDGGARRHTGRDSSRRIPRAAIDAAYTLVGPRTATFPAGPRTAAPPQGPRTAAAPPGPRTAALVEAAREIGVDEDPETLHRVFRKIVLHDSMKMMVDGKALITVAELTNLLDFRGRL